MISDKELARQMIERDVLNIYRQLPQISSNLGFNISPFLSLFQDKIFSYLDVGIDVVVNALFGQDESGNIDEAVDIAKMITNEKIEEYRKKIREEKEKILKDS